jgi:hypothetical protein
MVPVVPLPYASFGVHRTKGIALNTKRGVFSMWSAVECYRQGTVKHYRIELNDRVQPFGAIFYSARTDNKKLIDKAIKAMNKALSNGLTECTIEGCRRSYVVKWDSQCLTSNKQVSID